jgi:hypothetical protein
MEKTFRIIELVVCITFLLTLVLILFLALFLVRYFLPAVFSFML